MFAQILIVALGGAIGSVLRFLTAIFTARFFAGGFPMATFCVNIIGCFLIGFFSVVLLSPASMSPTLKLLLITGFCGGYTTFSAFAFEIHVLLQNGQYGIAISYLLTSIIIGVFCVLLGGYLGHVITK